MQGMARLWRRRAGMAGLIVVIIVLGYMMNVSLSQSTYVQAEFRARGARDNSRKAYYAAMSGVYFVVSRLRQDPSNTFVAPDNRLYFTSVVNSSNHSCSWMSANYGAANILGEKASDTYRFYNTFTTNLDTDPAEYRFILNTYPGVVPASEYLIKSQGTYQEVGSPNAFRAQVWAKLSIDVGTKYVAIVKARPMPVQTLTADNSGAEPDDFWDWEKFD